MERVFLRTTRTFDYSCGMHWKHECWIYSIDCGKEILHATQNQIIGTGELESITVQKPAFALGERVILCSHDKGTKQRLILGIALVHNSWFYIVELMSPTLTQSRAISNRFSLVGEKSLVRVNV
ncbi:MAG: DUF1392 family protein [Nostoc sp.]|uniref:DUF1392 family protein n=1 Tax=Nostoc sp. TaxID=1180 RepID=UPI002FFC845D